MASIFLDISNFKGILKGTWADITTTGDRYGMWTMDGTNLQGLYRPNTQGTSIDAYADINRNGIIDVNDTVAGNASFATATTGGRGTWSWDVTKKEGDYYNAYGDDVGDLRDVFLSNKDFLSAGVKLEGLSTVYLPQLKEGDGIFTTSINLYAGNQTSGNLAEGASIWWKITGISEEDLASGVLTGSGTITNGKLDLQHSLKADTDIGERFEVSVFSDSGMTQKIGTTESAAINEGLIPPSNSLTIKPQWISYTGSEVDDWQGGTAKFDNGDLVNAVTSVDTDGTSTVKVQRINALGDILWSVNLDADYSPSAGSILVGNDDNVYITGGTKKGVTGESGKNDSDIFATSLSPEGEILWYRNYGIGIHEIGATGVLDNSGNLILNGRISEVNDAFSFIKDIPDFYGAEFSGGWRGFQLNVNSEDGSVIKAYTTGSYNSGGELIASDESRNLVFVGGYTFGAVNGVSTIGNGDPAGANKYLIARDESTGVVLWTRMENWIRSNIVVQESEDAIYFVDKGVLEKVKGSTGETLWSEEVENTSYVLSPAEKGGILVAESMSNGQLIIKYIDASGLEVTTQSVNHQGELYLNALAEQADGSLVVSGTTTGDISADQNVIVLNQRISGKDAFVMQIDSNFSDPIVPTYTVTQSPTPSVAEGATLTTTVQTTDLPQGTQVFWSAGGTGIDADDFSAGALTGTATVGADGTFSFSHTLASDSKTEGTETLQIKLYSDSARTQQVGTTASTTVTDTSKTPPTYSVTQSPTPSVAEGATLITSVQTTELAAGTKVFWSVGGTNINANDFSAGALTGEATVGEDGKFSFSHTLAGDNKTEGSETLQVKLYSDSARTTQVGTTASTTVTDTSKTPPPIVHKEDGDAHASVNENLPRSQRSLIGMRYEKLNVDGDAAFESDLDSTSETSATTGNGNASTTSRHSLLGIELNGSSRFGGEGRFASIVTHESDNEATASNGTADTEEHINSVSVDVSDLAVSGRSSFGSYMSVGATNRADASQSRAGVVVTDASSTLNKDLAPNERSITGMRFERLTTDDSATFRSELENSVDTRATSDNGNAGALSNNSILGVGFSGTNRIGGDARVTSILSHNSFNDAQSTHGTASANEHNSIIGIEADNLSIQGNATFTSSVVVRAGSNSGT